MRIAYFSPLNPFKSGISDFSEELLPELAKYFDIDIFVDNYKPTNINILKKFNIYDMDIFDEDQVREKYDEFIYHIGNNEICHEKIVKYALKYPGIVELHDIALHHLLAATTIARKDIDAYKKEMEYCHGKKGVQAAEQFLNGEIPPPWETDSIKYTVNKRIVDTAKAIIVHSDYAKQMIKGVNPNKVVEKIYLHTPNIEENYEEYKKKCRQITNINENIKILASFGFATRNKRIIEIIYALRMLKDDGLDFQYYIVGQVDENLQLKKIIEQLDLSKNIIITGFVSLEEMKQLMGACDICLNLRYPTQGESSASLHRILGMGKAVVISDIGSFMEYPESVVSKISIVNEIEELYINLTKLLNDDNELERYKFNSLNFVKDNCLLEKNALKYKNFINNIHYDTNVDEDNLEILVNIFYDLEIYELNMIKNIVNKISDVF